MSVAYLPSPSQGVWHLGALPVRAYALFIVAGVLVAFGITGLRYRARGGEPGVILDVATWAIPNSGVGQAHVHAAIRMATRCLRGSTGDRDDLQFGVAEYGCRPARTRSRGQGG